VAAKGGLPEELERRVFTSTICSLLPSGIGFIYDDKLNNICFHYSRLTNFEFSDLKTGMTVNYTLEEDEERTKREGVDRYRAATVSVVV
jgi:cold shock CspA family protein